MVAGLFRASNGASEGLNGFAVHSPLLVPSHSHHQTVTLGRHNLALIQIPAYCVVGVIMYTLFQI